MSNLPDTYSEENEYLSKISKSCDICKFRKVKCDGLKPRCSNCLKNNKSCNYSLMKKPGLKNGYGKNLNEKLSLLETSNSEILDLLRDLSSRVEELEDERMNKRKKINPGIILSSSAGDTTNSEPSPAIMFPPLPQHQQQQQQQQQQQLQNFKNIQPVHQNQPAQIVASSSTSSTSSQPNLALALPSLLNPFVDSKERGLVDGLPSKQVMLKLYDLYFKYINPIFPILHPKTVLLKFESEKDSCVTYGVMLISLKYLNDDSFLRNEDKTKFYKSLKEKILLNCFDVSNLEKLATMLLLAFESMGQSNDQETWSLVAVVCSGAIHLDLVNEISSQVGADTPGSVNSTSSNPIKSISTRSLKLLKRPKDFIDEENRRRIFWCVYLLDRINGVISSTPLKIPDYLITCSYPLDTSKWLQNEKLGILDAFGYSLRLLKIFGETHNFNKMNVDITNVDECKSWYRAFNEIEVSLKNFVDSLPLKFSTLLINNDVSHFNTLSSFDILLHTIYNITVIKLHSPLGYPHNESDDFKHSEESRIVCSNCCNNVLNMVSKVGNLDTLAKLGPLYAIFLWIVTRVMIVEQILGQDDFEIIINENIRLKFKLDKLLNILDSIGDHWLIAKKYSKIIRFLSNMRIKVNNNKVERDGDAEDDDLDELVIKREPTAIISDMRLNTYYVSLMLTNQIEEKEKELLKGDTEFNGTDMSGSLFQLDLNGYGFEDFFKFLGDINEV